LTFEIVCAIIGLQENMKKGEIDMLLCKKIDLDLEEVRDVYENAIETITYLQDVVKSIDARVLDGEAIEGFILVPGRKSRTITPGGLAYLEAIFGREKIFVKTEKPIGITDLEKFAGPEDVATLITKGYIVFTQAGSKVGLVPKK
jgi:hypothetical protein